MLTKYYKFNIFVLLALLATVFYGINNKIVNFDFLIQTDNEVEKSIVKEINKNLNKFQISKVEGVNHSDVIRSEQYMLYIKNFFDNTKVKEMKDQFYGYFDNTIKKNIRLSENEIKRINSSFRNYSFKKVKGEIFYRLELISKNPSEIIKIINETIDISNNEAHKILSEAQKENFILDVNKLFLVNKKRINEHYLLLNFCKDKYAKSPEEYKAINKKSLSEISDNPSRFIIIDVNNQNLLNNFSNEKSSTRLDSGSSLTNVNKCATVVPEDFSTIYKSILEDDIYLLSINKSLKNIFIENEIKIDFFKIKISIQNLLNPYHLITIFILCWFLIIYVFYNKDKILKKIF